MNNSKTFLLMMLPVISNTVLGFPGLENEYVPSNLLEERGPCPGLNTLANHGFINRDGKNITGSNMAAAIEEVYGLDTAITDLIIDGFVDLGLSAGMTADGDPIINLFDLYPHNKGEHDSSLVRQDEYFGAFAQFDEVLFEDFAGLSSDGETITVREIGQQQANRIADSRLRNPEFDIFSDDDDDIAPPSALGSIINVDGRVLVMTGEAMFCLLFGQNDDLQHVSIADLFSFLGPNRIPEGWATRQQRNLPIFDTLALVQRLPDAQFLVDNIIEAATTDSANKMMDQESSPPTEEQSRSPTAAPSFETTTTASTTEDNLTSASSSCRMLSSIVTVSMATLLLYTAI